MSPDQRLTPQQAAELASCSVDTIRRAYRSGELPAYRVGAGVRIVREDLDAWLRRDPVQVERAAPPWPAPARSRARAPRGSLAALEAIERRRAS